MITEAKPREKGAYIVMRKKFKRKTVRGLRRFGKTVLCILLTVSFVFSFPFALSAGEVTPQTNEEASDVGGESAEYLEMPYEFRYDYGILPAHLADNSDYYAAYDQAELFYCEVDDNECVVWYDGTWTTSIVDKTYKGRGAKIQTSYSNILITDIGEYTASVKPGVAVGYSHFRNYMESNAYQFKSRLIYLNQVDIVASQARVAEYAGDYDGNFETSTITTDWGVTTFEGNTFYTVKDIVVLTADFQAPSDEITVTGEVTADEIPIIWIDCGETVRPAAPDTITYDILKTLKFKAYLVPKLAQSNEFTEVIFEATQISSDSRKIGFTATDPDALSGDEWRIVKLEDISEYGNYPLYTTKGDTGTTVKSPITDMAGNPFALDRTELLTKKPVYLDAKPTAVVSAEVNSNAIRVGEELDRADMFISNGDWAQLSLILSEEVFLLEDSDIDQIELKWDLVDERGKNVVTPLKEMKLIKPSQNMGNVTMLVFERVSIKKGMSGSVSPAELIGFECFEDASHNIMDGSLDGANLDKQLIIDNEGPTVEIIGDVIKHVDATDEKYLTVKLKIEDLGSGIMIDDIQKLSVSTEANVEGLTWQYAVTHNTDALTFEGNGFAVNKVKQYADFTLPVSGEYFLHLYLKLSEATELLDAVGVQLDFTVTDTKGNVSEASASLTDLGIDRKAPTLTVVPHAVLVARENDTTNSAIFRADVSAIDLNGVGRIEYQWTDEGVEPLENGWSLISSGGLVELTVGEALNTVTKILHVRAYDTVGNLSSYVSDAKSFTADLQRINSRYELVYDESKPGGISDVSVLAPVSSNAEYGGYTRVIVEIGGKTYVRVFNITDENTKISLLDTSATDWYLVTVGEGTYITVESGVPDWSYYGTISIDFSSSSLDLTPVVGGSLSAEGDTSFQQGNTFDMLYTSKNDGVHQVILNGVTDSSGIEVTLTETDAYKFYRINRSILGAKYNFSLTNQLIESLGVTDIDFSSSYAQFVVLDAEGNRTGELVGEPIPLAVGSAQSIAFPKSEYDSLSGAYGIVIYVAQKSGGKQEFFLEEKLLYDNDPIPEAYGVTEYGRFVENTYETTIDMSVRAEAGSYLNSMSIGVAKPSENQNGEGTIVYKDGKPAFIQTVVNGLGNTNWWVPSDVKLTISLPTSGSTYLGQTLGEIAGIRIWNTASSGDPSSIEWNSNIWGIGATSHYEQYLDLGWYSGDSSVMVISAEELATTDVSNFKLALGRNVICYQFIMENGRISPENRFEINLFDEAPTVEMSLQLGPSVRMHDFLRDDHYYYPLKGKDYVRTVAQSVYFNIDYAYSPNGELTVYRVYDDEETDTWVTEVVDGSQPIPMVTDSTNGYFGIKGTSTNFTTYSEPVTEIILVVDEVGNATAFYPIVSSGYSVDENNMYYFEKNPDVGKFGVTVIDPEEDGWTDHDGITQMISIDANFIINKSLEEISLQIGDRNEVKLDVQDYYFDQASNYDVYGKANDAGIVYYHNTSCIDYVLPYDPTVPEGEMIAHTVTVRGYVGGEIATDIDGNKAERTLTVTAPNIKPTLTLDESFTVGAVGVTANTYLYAKGITDYEAVDDGFATYDPETNETNYPVYMNNYSADFNLPIFKDGEYVYGFFDKYGQYYEIPVEVAGLPDDPTVVISEKQITKDPVTVTVTSENGGAFTVDTAALPAGTEVTGNGTSSLRIVLAENASFNITCTYSGASYDIPINVTNIYNKPIAPKVIWGYNQYKVNKEDNSYEGEVVATLVDENGSPLTDENGMTPTFTFVPGGQTSYVFTNYTNHVGMTGEDVIATLPVTLKVEQTEESANDTYPPDVGITGYSKYQSIARELNGGYVLTGTSRPSDAQFVLSNYLSKYGAENLHYDINGLLNQLGWAESLILNVDIIDENATRMFITSDVNAIAPDYATGTSDGIEGVSIVGRTLQITRNVEFALHVVDSKNNGAKVVFSVDALGDKPPSPTAVQVLTRGGKEVRIFLSTSHIDGVTDFKITNTDITPLVETDGNSAFFGQQYLLVTENGSVAVHYSYESYGQVFTGTVRTAVSCIDTEAPQVTATVWSANYDGTGENYTNRDVSAQMTFSKTLSDVYFCDKDGNRIAAPEGVTLVFIQDRATVIYDRNTPETYIKAVSSVNTSLTNVIRLPEIKTIDKLKPTLVATVELNSSRTQATVKLTASEAVTWQSGFKDIQFTQTVRENGSYTYRVADRAGNINEICVAIDNIVTDRLTLTLSSDSEGSNVIDPETYDVEVGDTVYVKVNRDAYVTVSGKAEGVSVAANAWTPVTVSEDSEGLYPSVLAVDSYGNSAIVQLLRIPMRDRVAPSVMLNKSLVSASIDASLEELEAILRLNVVATDDTTSSDALTFSFDVPEVTAAGKYAVTYYVEDEAGNRGSATGLIRFYNGEELKVSVNGETVESDQYVVVESGKVAITLSHNGEPYKFDMREGNKSLGQMKNNATALTDGYVDAIENEFLLDLTSGYYTFLVTTQGREMCRFVIYVMS